MAKRYTCRKFNGDDCYSWAVFRTKDIKGLGRGVIFWGSARPVISGMSRSSAQYERDKLEKKQPESGEK